MEQRRFHHSLPSRRTGEWRTTTIASKPPRVRNCVENCRRAPNRTLQIRLTIETKAAMGKNSVIFPAGCLTKK